MVEIDKYVRENNLQEDVRILATIHDELLFEVKKDKESCIKEIQKIMENILNIYNLKTDIPIVTNVKIGDRW